MFFLSPKIFGQSYMVLWDVRIMMSGILEVPKMSDMFKFLIKNGEFWVWLLIFLKK